MIHYTFKPQMTNMILQHQRPGGGGGRGFQMTPCLYFLYCVLSILNVVETAIEIFLL